MPYKKTLIGAASDVEEKSEPMKQRPPMPSLSDEDEELARIVEGLKVSIKIVGCGGGGSNTVNRCMREGIFGAEMIAANTDAKHLLTVAANKKILFGRRTTRGLGAGAIPQVGEAAAREAEEQILHALARTEITFITAGMGGGTGTGSAHIVAELAKRQKSLVISVVTLPFTSEGRVRMENALFGLDSLRKASDTTIVIPNDKLLQLVPRMPLDEAFRYADQILMEGIKGLTELVTKPGLVNIDYSDVKTIMSGGGIAMIGIGESDGMGQDRVKNAVKRAIYSPLVEADVSEANGAIVRVVGGEQMTLGDAEGAMRMVQESISQNARTIWGASVDPTMGDKLRVLVVLAGVKSPYMLSKEGEPSGAMKRLGVGGIDWELDNI